VAAFGEIALAVTPRTRKLLGGRARARQAQGAAEVDGEHRVPGFVAGLPDHVVAFPRGATASGATLGIARRDRMADATPGPGVQLPALDEPMRVDDPVSDRVECAGGDIADVVRLQPRPQVRRRRRR
jgi:hypothetical protein